MDKFLSLMLLCTLINKFRFNFDESPCTDVFEKLCYRVVLNLNNRTFSCK